MDSFIKYFEMINEMKKESNYSILENIPEEFLRSKDTINKITSDIYKTLNSKTKNLCLFPGCNSKSIKSHSLQKALLKRLVDSTNHIYNLSIKADFKLEGKIEAIIEKLSLNDASTFNGYCNKHDTEIFLPIEQGTIDFKNDKHNFLIVFRAVSREYFEVNKSYNLMKDTIDSQVKYLEETNPLGPYLIIQLYLQYCELFHLQKIKSFLDVCYENKIYKNIFEYKKIRINKEYKISVNSLFAVQGTIDDFTIKKDITKEMPSFFSLTIIPDSTGTDIFYAYLKEQTDELSPFIKRFSKANEENLELFLTDTILRNSDNIFIKPEYWDKIPYNDKNDILDFFFKTINNRELKDNKKLNLFKY